jgi:hypothetical protein
VRGLFDKRSARYAAQLREMVIELEEAVARGTQTQGMNASDTRTVMEHIDELLVSLYSEYEEFEEVSGMIAGTLLTVSERATAQRDRFWKKKLDENQQKAEADRLQAEAQAKLEWQKAEAGRLQAEAKQKKAEAKQKKAKAEQKKAEVERQEAEAERQKAEAKQKKLDMKLVRNLLAKGWQDAEIAEALELDVETVRLYAGST